MSRDDFLSFRGPTTAAIMPLVAGRQHVSSTGHYLATAAADHVFRAGGNAIDAGVAAGVALGVVMFDHVNYAGVAPIVLHHASSGKTVTIDGLGVWPRRSRPEHFVKHYGGQIPSGVLRTVVPAAPDAWLTALANFGTLTVAEVFEPAWELAHYGAPVATDVAHNLAGYGRNLDQFDRTTVQEFFPDGRPLRRGEIFARPALARVFKSQMDAEVRAIRDGLGRRAAVLAARDVFYRGWIAEEIDRFYSDNNGWLDAQDLANYAVEISPSICVDYHGYEVHGCSTWCQGAVLQQTLNILEQFDLNDLRHNSPEYMHLLVESMDRAFADREAYYGDPRFVDVPITGLLSKEYASVRAMEIETSRATARMPDPGDPWRFEPGKQDHEPATIDLEALNREDPDHWMFSKDIGERLSAPETDTSYVATLDERGNAFSATPSDPVLHGPVIPSLGFSCSARGYQSRVDPAHPASIEAGKRPRLTPSPTLVKRSDGLLIAMGCPGGDAQTQGIAQVLLNMIHFGMDPQEAIEAPRIVSWNFPDSFAPHTYYPARIDAEPRIPRPALEKLLAMGHDVGLAPDAWWYKASAVQVALRDPASGALLGATDPRADGAATAW